jgi:hypothetical protein
VWSGRDADHSPPSSAEVKNEYELHLLSPHAPPWRLAGQFCFALLFWYKSMDSHGETLKWENRRTRRRTCRSVTLSIINPIWTDPGANPSLRDERSGTNRLSHGTANKYTRAKRQPCRLALRCHINLLLQSRKNEAVSTFSFASVNSCTSHTGHILPQKFSRLSRHHLSPLNQQNTVHIIFFCFHNLSLGQRTAFRLTTRILYDVLKAEILLLMRCD